MIGEQAKCAFADCEKEFVKKTHNQIYHDDECCRLATNANIMKRYYSKKAQRLGLARFCTQCETKLSRYNSESICNSCSLGNELNRNDNAISRLMASISI